MSRWVDYLGAIPNKIVSVVNDQEISPMHKCFYAILSLVICSCVSAQQASNPSTTNATPATTGSAQGATSSTPPPPHTLLDGTPVKLRLSQTISSADAKTGQDVPFEVVEEVKVEDVIVIPKGAVALGTVTNAMPKRRMGREGKLDIAISYTRLTDQEKCALRASKEGRGGGHVGAMTGAMVGTAIVFFPAAPLFLFMHGKDITIPQGTEITAYVEGDMHLDMAKLGAVPSPGVVPATALAASTQATIMIESTPTGADIEVDGNFVGNTPSTVNVAPGNHEITIKKKGFANWNRKMNVSGGSIHLNAELETATAPAAIPALTGSAK